MPTSKRWNIVRAPVLLLSLLLVSCVENASSKPDTLLDGGFLSEEPCGPPCFFQITPGITNKTDALVALKTYALNQDCEAFDNTTQGGTRGILCPHTAIFGLDNHDLVDHIGFNPMPQIKIAEVISKYGEPDGVFVTVTGVPEGEYQSAMMVYYDSLETTLVLHEQKGRAFEVDSDTLVENIGYSNTDLYKLTRRYSVIWSGYGIYEVNNP